MRRLAHAEDAAQAVFGEDGLKEAALAEVNYQSGADQPGPSLPAASRGTSTSLMGTGIP
jgi:hypothetical protein